MNALWQIILRILWRLRPVQALEVNLLDAIQIGFANFADDAWLDLLATDPAYRRKIAAALFDAHRKLDLLIYHRACELAGVTTHLGFKPDYSCTHASTDIISLWRSFHRLVARFDDYERYAAKRAERLKCEATTIPPSLRDSPLRLDAAHQSTSPMLRMVQDTCAGARPPSRETRGRWIARTCAQDGGAARSHADPHSHADLRPFPTPQSQLPNSQSPARSHPHALEPSPNPAIVRP